MKYKGMIYGITLALASAVATGTFGIFLNYFNALGISEDAMATLTPMTIFSFYLIVIVIKRPKDLILPRKWFYFTLLICSGLIASSIYIYSSIRAFNALPIAVASLLDFSNALVLIVLMRIFFKSKISKEKIISCAIALIGISLVLNLLGTNRGDITSIGIFWGIINCVSLAVAYMFDYYHISNGVSYLAYLVYNSFMSLFLFSFKATPVQVFQEFHAVTAQAGLTLWFMLILYCAVLVISYGTIAVSYKYIEASTASLTFVAEPATAALLGYFILRQELTMLQIIGIIITVGAILYMEYNGNKADERALKLKQLDAANEKKASPYER